MYTRDIVVTENSLVFVPAPLATTHTHTHSLLGTGSVSKWANKLLSLGFSSPSTAGPMFLGALWYPSPVEWCLALSAQEKSRSIEQRDKQYPPFHKHSWSLGEMVLRPYKLERVWLGLKEANKYPAQNLDWQSPGRWNIQGQCKVSSNPNRKRPAVLCRWHSPLWESDASCEFQVKNWVGSETHRLSDLPQGYTARAGTNKYT